jgi:putative DNA primase/helicase
MTDNGNGSAGVALEFNGAIITPEPEPPPINGAELLHDLVAYYEKYVRVTADEYTVLAAWVLHCHAFKAFSRTPYLNISSATNGCGKTQLLEITELLVPEGLLVSSTTSAVLARAIDALHPVLLMDELDQLLAGDKDLLAAVLATINSGYKKSGYRLILEPKKGGGWVTKKLSTYSAKVLSGISSLPAVTLSRCIPITMERMLPRDRVAEIDEFIIEPEAAKLFDRAKLWAQQNKKQLRDARPDAPPELGHRQREVSRPLFAIGDVVGGVWPEQIRSAVARLFTARNAAPSDDIKVELLQDIKQAFAEKDRIASTDLIDALVGMADRPWATWGRGKPINQNQLARQLRDFKVYSKTVRIEDGRILKGYLREWFEPIWDRWIPIPDLQPLHPLQSSIHAGPSHFSKPLQDASVTVEENAESPMFTRVVTGVTDPKPERGRDAKKSWAEGLICPGCRGIWDNHVSLVRHLPQCRLFDFGAMLLTESRMLRGQSAAPELRARYEDYLRLGIGPLPSSNPVE